MSGWHQVVSGAKHQWGLGGTADSRDTPSQTGVTATPPLHCHASVATTVVTTHWQNVLFRNLVSRHTTGGFNEGGENVSKLAVTCWRDIEPSLLQKHEVVISPDVSLKRVILAKVLSSVNTKLAPHISHLMFRSWRRPGVKHSNSYSSYSVEIKREYKLLYQFMSFIDRIDLIKSQGGGTVKISPDLLWVNFEIVVRYYRALCVYIVIY